MTAARSCAEPLPPLPVRPPVLCAGCPHRASFYAVKQAMKGQKAVFSGDIGCYTLGNATPLDMVDTCLCMGAGVTIAQGLHRVEPDTVNFRLYRRLHLLRTPASPGWSTPFIIRPISSSIVLDNSTTAMTGHQPHPGTGTHHDGRSLPEKISIAASAKGHRGQIMWPRSIPWILTAAVEAVQRRRRGQRRFRCHLPVPLYRRHKARRLSTLWTPAKCIGCKRCIRELGCPAIVDGGQEGGH